jgi:L-2-hydroxyglutarate oxidase LhgO
MRTLHRPALTDGALVSDYSGVRPKISAQGEAAADFIIWSGKEHSACSGKDLRGIDNIFGIASPGLTASLAIADASCDALCLDR